MELNTQIVTIFSLIVSVVLVSIVIFQYQLARKQYETVNQPGLVLNKGNRIVDNVELYLENIGNLPAQKITINSEDVFSRIGDEKIPI